MAKQSGKKQETPDHSQQESEILSRAELEGSSQEATQTSGESSGDSAKDRESSPVKTYDFKHPMRVSRDQQRTLENLHSHFGRLMASSFSTSLRSVVDVDIAYVDQTTYAEFIMSLPNPSCSYTFTMQPFGGPAVLDYPPPVANTFVDRRFGGTGAKPPTESHPLTSVERTIMGKVLTRNLADLEATWEALLQIQISDAELETNPEFMQVAAPSDTVILTAFEFNSQHCSGIISLCYPYFTLEPVMSYLNVRTWAGRAHGNRESDQRRQNRLDQLKGIRAELSLHWGRGTLSAEELASLREGDTLILDTRVDEPGVLFVEDQPLFLVCPGANGKNRYAVEIQRCIPKEEARHYV